MAEDAATILEHFVHDVSNLPAEIAHITEEIQAKDKLLKEHLDSAIARDNSLQKHIRLHGSHVENPKEAVYVEQIRKHHKRILELQDEKVALVHKGKELVDKHIKRLDGKINDLVRDGQMAPEVAIASQPNIPPAHVRQPSVRASPVPTHVRSSSIHSTPAAARPNSPAASANSPSFPASLSGTGIRDSHDVKRRRLNTVSTSNFSSSAPAISSNLASSHPSTPGIKAEPAAPRAGTPNLLKKGSSTAAARKAAAMAAKRDRDDSEDEEEEEDEAGEDKNLYCICQQVSYGNMVACDGRDCEKEWFHWACVGVTQAPSGKWYCPECTIKREKRGIR